MNISLSGSYPLNKMHTQKTPVYYQEATKAIVYCAHSHLLKIECSNLQASNYSNVSHSAIKKCSKHDMYETVARVTCYTKNDRKHTVNVQVFFFKKILQ